MLKVTRRAGVAEWQLDRPAQRNAFNHELLDALAEATAEVAASDARVLLIHGAGGVFSAGGDIKLLGALDGPAAAEAFSRKIQKVFDDIACLPQVVIAAIEGYALGGGLELACCCDLRVAARTARLGTPEIDLGLFPAAGGVYRL
ncbi:MAG TPA: enoyl-CoA hydratase/isomerase family protein, partial [Limnochordia bacterium]|nr:enoyl-CoA hydratase/isomerase family protein [Limnochordia bacterium]